MILDTIDYVRAEDSVLCAHKRVSDDYIEAVLDTINGPEQHVFYKPTNDSGKVMIDSSFDEKPEMFRYNKNLDTWFFTNKVKFKQKDSDEQTEGN